MHVTLFAVAGLWITRGAAAVHQLGDTRVRAEHIEPIALPPVTPARPRETVAPRRVTPSAPQRELAVDSGRIRAELTRWAQEREAERANANARWLEITEAANRELIFENERTEPVMASMEALNRIVVVLLNYPAVRVRLEQTVDEVLAKDQRTLPWRRAASVRNYLVASGADSARVLIVVDPARGSVCSREEPLCRARQIMRTKAEIFIAEPPVR